MIFLDTETRWEQVGDDELHRLRLWTACHVDRRAQGHKRPGAEWGWGSTRGELADWLIGRMVGRACVWAYAHNLNFDLVTSDLAGQMSRRGWEVKEFSISHGSPFLRLGQGKKTLTVLDSFNWLPERLESLATLMGRHKLDLPANDDTEDAWVRRCAVDVDLLARSVLGLMDWWDAEGLGRWTISGAGCGWNAMRHIHTPQRHVIQMGPEPEELPREAEWVQEAVRAGQEAPYVALDRLACRGGRKDAAVIRSATGGPWVELDIASAYPMVARELPLPVKRGWTFDTLPTDSKWIGSRFWGVIAEAVISTDAPRYPVRHRGVTWYPVGTFTTTLAGPELTWARDSGHLVSVGRGQAHRLGLALRPWATWVMDPTRGGQVTVPPVASVACRNWGRAVLGKFAARASTTVMLEGVAPDGWTVMDTWNGMAHRRGGDVTMGGHRWLITYDADTENCYPAVYAWVESEVRVRLGKVLEALDGAWWTADTDGLLVDMAVIREWLRWNQLRLGHRPRDAMGLAAALCDWLAPLVAPLTIRPKRAFDSLAVLGPMHQVRGGERKMSGVSKAAEQTAEWAFQGRDWPGLKWQMENSPAGTYTRPLRKSTFVGPTVHRWTMDDGSTRPVEMAMAADGSNHILPWLESRWSGEDVTVAPTQYRLLQTVG